MRSIWGTLAIVLMLVAVIPSALGFAGWAGLRLFGESSAALFVLMAVTVAHSVHIIEGMATGLGQGMARTEAAIHTLRVNVWPCFPYLVHNCNRISKSEFRRYAAVSGHG